MFQDLREQSKAFSGVAAYYDLIPASVGGAGDAERVWGQAVTSNLFDVAQIHMPLGRGFTSGEEQVGLYGVMSYSISRRTREIGIRMALGAQAGAVRGMVVRQGMMLTAIASALGLSAAWVVAKSRTTSPPSSSCRCSWPPWLSWRAGFPRAAPRASTLSRPCVRSN